MNQNTPESITTRIKTSKDRTVSIIFNPGSFMDLNQAYAEEMGEPLMTVAETNPVEAYRFIRRMIGRNAALYSVSLALDGSVTTATVHGIETTRAVAEETVLSVMPSEHEGPRVVRIAIQQMETDSTTDTNEPIQLLELNVTPPDLAR